MAGKVILLVGSSGGLGTKMSTMFQDDTLILHYHSSRPIDPHYSVSADVTDYTDVERMIRDVTARVGRIDVLVNLAGISSDGFAHKFDPGDWRSVIDTNLVGAFHLTRAVLPGMRANKYGRIILMASVVYQHAVMGTSAYSASKAGLVGLTRTLALENLSLGITCNCIALGYFDAGMLYALSDDERERIRQLIPMKRFGRVEELYQTIEYLIDTEYITGQVISVNGGLYMD